MQSFSALCEQLFKSCMKYVILTFETFVNNLLFVYLVKK